MPTPVLTVVDAAKSSFRLTLPAGASVAVEVAAAAPAPTKARGFTVKGAQILDPAGKPWIPRGINHTVAWGHHENNLRAIAEIAKTGANCIRLVFRSGLGYDTPAEQRVVVEECLRVGLVPILGCWDATGSDKPDALLACASFWTAPATAALLKQYADRVIVNVANEWGSSQPVGFDGAAWRAAYKPAIASMRAAGIDCLLMVDAGGGFGQNPRSIRDHGAGVLADDPLHSVVFDLHCYAFHRSKSTAAGIKDGRAVGAVGKWNDAGTQSPWLTSAEIKAIVDKGLAVVVGEIAWQGSDLVGYMTAELLADLRALGVGFCAWSWNQNSDQAIDLMRLNSGWQYGGAGDLSPGGVVFVGELKATARPATY